MKAPGGVLVLGGTGFVGAHIAAAFDRAGHAVSTGSRRSTSDHRWPHLHVDLHRTDITETVSTLSALAPAVVVNAAGGYWGHTPEEMIDTLTGTAAHLVDAVSRSEIADTVRVVHLGSVMEYAPTPAGVPTSTDTPTEPESGYGRAKLAATEIVAGADVDTVVLRATNNIGPGAHEGSLLGKVATRLREAEPNAGPVTINLSPLQAFRDYLDVRDLGDACVAAAACARTSVPTPIGRGEAFAVRDLVDRLIAVSGVEARVVEDESAPRAPGSASAWLQVDTKPAVRLIGWRATRSVDAALADFWSASARVGR